MQEDEVGLDVEILQQGAICMYFDNNILDNDLDWFSKSNYEVFDMDTSSWTSKTIHAKIKNCLNFPDYYGENMSAFDDCLDDMYNKRYRGLVIVFRRFDIISELDKEVCEGLLDSIAEASRRWLVSGQKLIGVIQSEDPDLSYRKVGAVRPFWNGQEWLDENRKK